MLPNRRLLVPYAAPILAYGFIASALGDQLPVAANYLLRIVVCGCLLFWASKWYMQLTGPRSIMGSIAAGIATGLAGCLIWIALLLPFAPDPEELSWTTSSIILRIIAASLLVPIFEEIVMRGMIFRLAHQWWEIRKAGKDQPLARALDDYSVNDVEPGAWSWPAVLISTVVFTSGHLVYEWPASIAYGLLMAGLWIYRRDLLSCIVAHGVTNLTLALYVITSGSWMLW